MKVMFAELRFIYLTLILTRVCYQDNNAEIKPCYAGKLLWPGLGLASSPAFWKC